MSKGIRLAVSKKPLGEVTKLIDIRTLYPKKDISFICMYHKLLRQPSTDEIFEQSLGEGNLLTRLERTGDYWKNQPTPDTKDFRKKLKQYFAKN